MTTHRGRQRRDRRGTSMPGRPICAACFTPTGPISPTTRSRPRSAIFSAPSRSIRSFALAHAKLSAMQTQYYMFGYDASRERLELARQSLDRALALDPRLPEAQLAASSYWLTAGDLAKALAAAEAAERLRPNDAATLSATASVLWRIGTLGGCRVQARSRVPARTARRDAGRAARRHPHSACANIARRGTRRSSRSRSNAIR